MTRRVRALVFRRDGTRTDYTDTARVPVLRFPVRRPWSVAWRAHEGGQPAYDLIEVEDIPDTGWGSTDGTVAVYAPRGEFARFCHTISGGLLESLPARRRGAILETLWDLCAHDGVTYRPVWVKPQPADAPHDVLVFEILARRVGGRRSA